MSLSFHSLYPLKIKVCSDAINKLPPTYEIIKQLFAPSNVVNSQLATRFTDFCNIVYQFQWTFNYRSASNDTNFKANDD